MSDHRLFVGTNGDTEYLAHLYDDGTVAVAHRPDDIGSHTWGRPAILAELPMEPS